MSTSTAIHIHLSFRTYPYPTYAQIRRVDDRRGKVTPPEERPAACGILLSNHLCRKVPMIPITDSAAHAHAAARARATARPRAGGPARAARNNRAP